MITSSETVEGVPGRLLQAIEVTEARLVSRFVAEKAEGVLPSDFPSEERARLLFDLRQGQVFRARAGQSAGRLNADVESWIGLVLAPASQPALAVES